MQVNEGTQVTISAEFRTAAGTLTDPTDVYFKANYGGTTYAWHYGVHIYTVTTSQGTATNNAPPEIVKDGTGLYHLDWSAPAGEWTCYFQGTGTVKAVSIANFVVKALPFT